MTLLEARGLAVTIAGRALLQAVDLTVAAGEVVALVGPNGAGKSTLLKVVAGDLPAQSGEVRIDGRPLGDYKAGELALRRAVMPQQTVLQFAFSAWEVVRMGRSPHRPRRGEPLDDEQVISTALASTETLHLAERSYPTLSGGEQARVTLARVLAQQNPLLLLDEPTTSLDIHHQHMVMSVARRLANEGAGVLAILHDLNLAAAYADRIAMLSGGRLVACDAPWQVLTETLLLQVFEHPVAVTTHPTHGGPLVLPLPW